MSAHSSDHVSDTTTARPSALTRTYGKSVLSTTRKARSSCLMFLTNCASGLPMTQKTWPSHSYQTGLTYGQPSRSVPSLAIRPPSVRKLLISSGSSGGMGSSDYQAARTLVLHEPGPVTWRGHLPTWGKTEEGVHETCVQSANGWRAAGERLHVSPGNTNRGADGRAQARGTS